MTQIPKIPRWVNKLRASIDDSMKENKDSISYAFSTLDKPGLFSAPRTRFVVHRGFVNERRSGEDPTWSVNEPTYPDGSELISSSIMVTTDVRAPKALQISSNPEGGITEIAWWMTPVAHQYRIRGRAFIMPNPSHPLYAQFPHARLSPYTTSQESTKPFDWDAERIRIFRKMSPALRASYCRPTPGTPLSHNGKDGGDIDPKTFPTELPTDLDAKTDEEKAFIKTALLNMALIVIEPFEIDWCDLKASPNERVVWSKESDGNWKETSVVP